VSATWVCMVAAIGATIALTVWWKVDGLPALPAVAIGFLVPNADLLWRSVRSGHVQGQSLDASEPDGPSSTGTRA
jgi:hypothetical protein